MWLKIIACVLIAIFGVYEVFSLVKDIRKFRKDKSAVKNDGLKGDENK